MENAPSAGGAMLAISENINLAIDAASASQATHGPGATSANTRNRRGTDGGTENGNVGDQHGRQRVGRLRKAPLVLVVK